MQLRTCCSSSTLRNKSLALGQSSENPTMEAGVLGPTLSTLVESSFASNYNASHINIQNFVAINLCILYFPYLNPLLIYYRLQDQI